jgi:hypothetical protein
VSTSIADRILLHPEDTALRGMDDEIATTAASRKEAVIYTQALEESEAI